MLQPDAAEFIFLPWHESRGNFLDHLMNTSFTSFPLASDSGAIIDGVGQALESIHAANAAVVLLAEHLLPILPNGATEEIGSLIAAATLQEDGKENLQTVEGLVSALSRRAEVLAGSLHALREAVRR